MVNVALIGRSTVRYSLGYAGVVAGAVFGAFRSPLAMGGLFFLGLVALLTARSSETRSQALNSGARVTGNMKMRGHDADMADAATEQPGNIKALFFGLGLVVLGAAGAIITAG